MINFFLHQHVGFDIAEIQLARAPALNSINEYMSLKLAYVLESWLQDSRIKTILITSNGPHFCAGADLATLAAQVKVKPGAKADFIRRQYQIIQDLRQTPKDVIAVADGATMGFGAGLLMAAKHRIIGPKFRLAMPECCLGFLPDVGSAKFLARLPSATKSAMLAEGRAISGLELAKHQLITQAIAEIEMPSCLAALRQGLPFTSEFVPIAITDSPQRKAAPQALAYAQTLFAMAETLDYRELAAYEYALARTLINTADFTEGIAAFFGKREPVWQTKLLEVSVAMLQEIRSQYSYFD